MSKFLFIASDWQGAMVSPGGVATYVSSLTQAFRSLGDTVKMLEVFRPEERRQIGFREEHEPWLIPFPMKRDNKPENRLGSKAISALEILRCISPSCRRLLERSVLFESSVDSIKRLRKLISEEKPDAIVFTYLDVKLYPLALCLVEQKMPYVIIAHDAEIRQATKNARNDLAIRGMMLRGADWVAANSHHTKELLEVWRIPPDRVRVIYPPISQDTINESDVLGPRAQNQDKFTFVTICRLVRGKGTDLVLQALRILDSRGIPYVYLIGGEGPERESLEAMVDEFGLRSKVRFMGPVVGHEKWSLLRKGDVFVTPSRVDPTIPWQEGFGIAFVEAAAFGLPAVASRSGGIPEAVVDGETGILVPEESYLGLADALISLYREPEKRKAMGRAARERAQEQFSPNAIANRFREEFAKAALNRSEARNVNSLVAGEF
jgi:phosphatidylinositol alpha-1,6-mannosyltransferase